MHEISLLENVREIMQDHAQRQNFSRVTKVTLEIGKLSCVEPDALRFGFDVVMNGTLAEKAELILLEINGTGLCDKCGEQVTMTSLSDPCTCCGNPYVKATQGLDMKIKDLIVI